MLRLVYGLPGSKKSDYLYSMIIDNLTDGGKSVLVVPEQKALSCERRIYEAASSHSLLGLEVINFDRLCELVFRKCGSLSLNYVTESTKKLLLSRALADISPSLSEYTGRYDDEAYVSLVLSQLTEFKYARITPTLLSSARKSISASNNDSHKRLVRKLDDLSLIFASYNAIVSEAGCDSCDRLTTAAELIRETNPFADHKIYFDSFNGFTAQEYEIIRALLSHGTEITVTLCHPGKSSDEVFLFTQSTEAALIRCAESTGSEIEKVIIGDDTYNSDALSHLSRSFTAAGTTDKPFETQDLSIISCSDIFDECDTCAALIAREVRRGLRYKDIMIIVRDIESYKGMIDSALERYGIPCFISDKTDITQKSLIRFILTALSIVKGSPRYTDIITYIRCGLTDLSPYDADLLESYASCWKVSGKIWYSDEGFTMNPRGYMELNAEDADMLAFINELRLRVMTPLATLRDNIKDCKQVNDYSRAIYNFIANSSVKEQLAYRHSEMLSRGERILAAEESSLWKAFCDALDELDLALSTHVCDIDEYLKLLNMVIADTDIGTIPQSSDAVVISDAIQLRADDAKHTFMLGCEEGSFPRSTSVGGMLSLEDRKILAEHRLEEIAYDPVCEASRELFLFYCSACSPSDSLTLSYSRRSLSNEDLFPSSALLRVGSLFGNTVSNSSDLKIDERICTTNSFVEHVPYLKSLFPDSKIDEIVNSDTEIKRLYSSCCAPISRVDERLSDKSVSLVFPGNLHVSQSRTEAFVKCPFSFQCKYALKLDMRPSDSIQKNDIGTLVHAVLDDFLENGIDDVIVDGSVDKNKVTEKINSYTEAKSRLLLEFTPEEKRARVSRMLKRVAHITALCAQNLAQEAAQSNFTSSFFEFPVSSHGGLMPIKLMLEDGSYLLLGGIADRVDTMVKGDKLYVRVVDYKTGTRTFSLDSIRAGLGLQLLIYLFSIWENADDTFRRAAGAPSGCEIVPAGAEYIMTMPGASAGTNDPDEIAGYISKAFKRSGIYLADPEIINDMDKGLSGKFVPVNMNLNSTAQAVVQSLEEFNELKDEVSAILVDIGNGIKRGDAEIKPLKQPSLSTDACAYCHMKPVCKNAAVTTQTAE